MRRSLLIVLALLLVRPAAAGDAALRCDPDCNVRVTNVQGPANEVALAVDPSNPAHVIAAAKDYTYGAGPRACSAYRVWAGIYNSKDGGRSWSEQLLAPPPGNYDCITDPVLAFGPHGTAYFVGLGLRNGAGNRLFVERSLDGGATWTYSGLVTQIGNPDKEWAAVDPLTGRLWVAWVDTNLYTLEVAHSDDLGQTWTQSTVPAGLARGMGIAIGPPDALGRTPVHVAWKDVGSAAVQYAFSVDEGRTWVVRPAAPLLSTGDEIQTRPFRTHAFPSVGVAPDGTVYIAYPDLVQSRGEIRVVRTMGSPAVWGPPVPVDVSPLTDEIMPQLAISPSGDIDVVYYSHHEGRLDVRLAHSRDGLLWEPPVRLTTVSSDPALSRHQDGFVFVGDYIGAASTPGAAYAAWADTRNGRADVYFAALER